MSWLPACRRQPIIISCDHGYEKCVMLHRHPAAHISHYLSIYVVLVSCFQREMFDHRLTQCWCVKFLLLINTGRLATGDCRHNIHLWWPQSAGSWNVDQRPYSAHSASVEDIQWSPSEPNVCLLMMSSISGCKSRFILITFWAISNRLSDIRYFLYHAIHRVYVLYNFI